MLPDESDATTTLTPTEGATDGGRPCVDQPVVAMSGERPQVALHLRPPPLEHGRPDICNRRLQHTGRACRGDEREIPLRVEDPLDGSHALVSREDALRLDVPVKAANQARPCFHEPAPRKLPQLSSSLVPPRLDGDGKLPLHFRHTRIRIEPALQRSLVGDRIDEVEIVLVPFPQQP